MFLRKYATGLSGSTKIRIPLPKAGSMDFATNSDWTPATGDVKVCLDDGTDTNIATLPSYDNGAWEFVLSSGELTCKQVCVKIIDSATKAVDDQFFIVETFGNASAMYQVDFTDVAAFGLTALSTDIYHADIHFCRDVANSQDEYLVTWFKNGVLLTSGVTSPTLRVIKRSDGSNLFSAASLTECGSTHHFKLDKLTTERITIGESGIAVVQATIDSATRTFSRIVGRDSN